MEAYEEVQRRKDEASFEEWPPSMVPTVAKIAANLKRELGTVNPAVLEHAVNGMAWVARMMHEEGLDVDETMEVPRRIQGNVERQLGDTGIAFTPQQGIQAGIGAGLFTGLWMGLLMRKPEGS